MKKQAIILCSGGLDSVTTAFHVKYNLNYQNLTLLFFNYKQRTLKPEKKAAKFAAKKLKAKFVEVKLPELAKLSNSQLNQNTKAHTLSRKSLKNTKKESQNWYVPLRNTIFLNYASALAESIFLKTKSAPDIIVGFKNEGQESYPDTTPQFVNQMNKLNSIGSQANPKILAPLIKKDKEDIISLAVKLSVPVEKTYSCYSGTKKHCGYCLACKLRQEGFYWANQEDPTVYSSKSP